MGGLRDGFDANQFCSLSLDSGCGRKIYWDLPESIQNYGNTHERRISLQSNASRIRWVQTTERPVPVDRINREFAQVRLGSIKFSMGVTNNGRLSKWKLPYLRSCGSTALISSFLLVLQARLY